MTEWFERMRQLYEASPVHELFNLRLAALEPGSATVAFSPRPELRNVYGAVHGGILATIVDSAILQSVRTLLGEEDRLTTLELKINYVAPATGPSFTCRGDVVRLGGSVGVARATLSDSKEEVVAACLGTIHVKRAR